MNLKESELTSIEKEIADIALLRELSRHILALFRYLNFDKRGKMQPTHDRAMMIYTLWLSALAIVENWETELEQLPAPAREDIVKEYVENKINELWEEED